MEHSVVYYEPGKFAGWPANCGIWSWDNEILASYNVGDFDAESTGHRINPSTIVAGFARSMDGGRTWEREASQREIFERPVKPVPPEGFDCTHPGFTFRVGQPSVRIESNRYLVSYDRGLSWDGPYTLPSFGYQLTARTCYHVEGPKTIRIYLSYALPSSTRTAYSDRAFVAVATDGGKTWEFAGDMTTDLPRSVMPDVVRMPDGTLVAAMRRRFEYSKYEPGILEEYTRMPWNDDNWIEIRRSGDNGRTWKSPVRAAETAHEYGRNGNPPALGRLDDTTLVLVYGYRGEHPSIRYKVSHDAGYTFERERVLRGDALMHDLGYPRLAVRNDGMCVAVYYITTEAGPENHIEATVFDPLEE